MEIFSRLRRRKCARTVRLKCESRGCAFRALSQGSMLSDGGEECLGTGGNQEGLRVSAFVGDVDDDSVMQDVHSDLHCPQPGCNEGAAELTNGVAYLFGYLHGKIRVGVGSLKMGCVCAAAN
jgi:hypothetical protein